MKTYPIPMVPGPVSVPEKIRKVYETDYGSGDLESEFFDLYARTGKNLREIMGTENSVAILSGEGMLALWGALKSCLKPGDRVLAIGTGVFGRGIGHMAASVGAEVKAVDLPDNKTIGNLDEIEKAVDQFKPKMITAVHCETPSGTLNPLIGVGRIKRDRKVPLFYVDAVSSVGGVPVLTDKRHIDLCLGGSQKCLSAPPGNCFLSIGDAAWEIIEEVGYEGYDALQPFRKAEETKFFPYTPDWYSVAALNAGAELILEEGLLNCFDRHQHVAVHCRQKLLEAGLTLFPSMDSAPSPTVTAVNVPPGIAWPELDARFRQRGLVVGGSMGPMEGKVFRLGHMGSQATMDLIDKALAVINETV